MTTKEVRSNRRLTQRFIQTSPSYIRLTPYERLPDDQGAWRLAAGEVRHTQRFRLIEGGSVGTNVAAQATSVDGIIREVEFELLGSYDAEIDLYDRFSLGDVEYEVTQVWPDNGYERRASVSRYG